MSRDKLPLYFGCVQRFRAVAEKLAVLAQKGLGRPVRISGEGSGDGVRDAFAAAVRAAQETVPGGNQLWSADDGVKIHVDLRQARAQSVRAFALAGGDRVHRG
jgi:hypothetical protein